MGKAVVLEDNVVTNIIVIDENTPKELYDIEVDEDTKVSIGWVYSKNKFVEPKNKS